MSILDALMKIARRRQLRRQLLISRASWRALPAQKPAQGDTRR